MPNPSTAAEMGIRPHSLQPLLSSLTTELLNYVLSFFAILLAPGHFGTASKEAPSVHMQPAL